MPFPTVTDLAFYQARHKPRWANRITSRLPPSLADYPNINHVINDHAGVRTGDTTAHNLMVLIRGWSRRGEGVLGRLLDLANNDHLCATPNQKRAALAKKWAARCT